MSTRALKKLGLIESSINYSDDSDEEVQQKPKNAFDLVAF
jgi:hypothetical protein